MHLLLLLLATFAASTVEMVEALTIVLAIGLTRGWRSAGAGVLAAVLTLAVLVAAIGPAISHLPIATLRVVVGGFLLVFGLQWLRKAILRAAGLKALHDEAAIYEREVAAAEASESDRRNLDRYGFIVAYKGVFLEGLEVVFIVLTFGAAQGHLALASLAAVAALVLVTVVGLAAHRPLSRVPENSLKFGVGVLLVSFGMFWSVEGTGAHWPGGDALLPVLMGVVAASALVMIAALRRAGRVAGRSGLA